MTLSGDDFRVWLITGASSGLGRALAEAALGRGDKVVATARDPQRLDDLAGRYPGQVIAARLDVTDVDEARAAVADGLAAFGRLDIVVNNAGYGLFGALEELPGEELRREFETNVFGALNVTRAALSQLRRQRSARPALLAQFAAHQEDADQHCQKQHSGAGNHQARPADVQGHEARVIEFRGSCKL